MKLIFQGQKNSFFREIDFTIKIFRQIKFTRNPFKMVSYIHTICLLTTAFRLGNRIFLELSLCSNHDVYKFILYLIKLTTFRSNSQFLESKKIAFIVKRNLNNLSSSNCTQEIFFSNVEGICIVATEFYF